MSKKLAFICFVALLVGLSSHPVNGEISIGGGATFIGIPDIYIPGFQITAGLGVIGRLGIAPSVSFYSDGYGAGQLGFTFSIGVIRLCAMVDLTFGSEEGFLPQIALCARIQSNLGNSRIEVYNQVNFKIPLQPRFSQIQFDSGLLIRF